MENAAPIDSKSKLEETSLLCTVSLLNWYGSKHKYLSFLSAQEINCIFESRKFSTYTLQSKAVLSALLSAAYANAFLTSVDERNGLL